MWQTLETKCRFIAQVMTGDATVRRAEDVDSAALTYAEVKAIASGNPLVIEKAAIDAEVIRLTRLNKQHVENLYQMRYRIRRLTDTAAITEREIANIREDLRTRTSTRGDNFVMTVKNETFTGRVKAGRAIVFLAALKPFESSKTIGNIGGFPVCIERFDERATLLIHGKHRAIEMRPFMSSVSSFAISRTDASSCSRKICAARRARCSGRPRACNASTLRSIALPKVSR
ncbi:hypothetical protein BH20VER3_BH20VER3_07230 [soil metagenome]